MNIFAIPTIQVRRLARLKGSKTSSPCTLRVPFDYDVACQTIQGSSDSFLMWNLENLSSRAWIQPLVIFTIAKYHCSFVIESSFIPSRSRYDFKCQQLSNCDVINMRATSYCDVTLTYYSDTVSMDAFIITMALSARAFRHVGSSPWSSRDLSLCFASYIFLSQHGGYIWTGAYLAPEVLQRRWWRCLGGMYQKCLKWYGMHTRNDLNELQHYRFEHSYVVKYIYSHVSLINCSVSSVGAKKS